MKTLLIAAVLGSAALAFTPAPATASVLSFDVVVDTMSLLPLEATGGPFALDFQLNGLGGNTVVIDNFGFGGGAPLGAVSTFGQATGSLASSVTVSDSASFANEFFQQFTAGAFVRFRVTTTTNVVSPTPDAFSFAILDGALFNIPTTGLGDSLIRLDINSPFISQASVIEAAGAGNYAGVTAEVVPEPGSLLLLGSGLAGLRAWRKRRVA